MTGAATTLLHAQLLPDPTWRMTRRMDADPVSAALLMGGPDALALWPGLRGVTPGRHGLRIRLTLPSGPTTAVVRAAAPQRSARGIVCRFRAQGPDLPELRAVLTLRPATDPRAGRPAPRRATLAELALRLGDGGPPALSRVVLQRGMRFLDALAGAAEARAVAA